MSTAAFAQGAKLNLIANVIQKLITFSLNQILLRWTTPEVVGQASIQLELLLSTMLFLSREGIRLACLRERIENDVDRAALVNISWIPFLIVVLFGGTLIVFGGSSISLVVILYWGGACLESLAEPWFNLFQNALLFSVKAKAEMVAVFIRCIVAFLCVGYLQMHLTGFGFTQFAYGVTYLLVLMAHMKSSNIKNDNGTSLTFRNFFPAFLSKPSPSKAHYHNLIQQSTAHVAASSVVSSLVKHGLTEADKIVLTLSTTSYHQGIYAVTNNYGSLVARMIFLPLEDASKLIFSVHISSLRSLNSTTKERVDSLVAMKTLLIQLLRLVCIIAIFFPVFGYSYSEVAVNLIFSSQWRTSETVNTLSYYCFYIFVMALNGISEAFVQSTFPASAYKRLSFGLLLSTVVFVMSAVTGIHYLGTSGIVVANAASYLSRIGYNMWMIHHAFNNVEIEFLDNVIDHKDTTFSEKLKAINSPLTSLIPSFSGVLICVLYFIISCLLAKRYSMTSMSLKDTLLHIALGGIAAISFLLVVVFKLCPKEDVAQFKQLLIRKKDNQHNKTD